MAKQNITKISDSSACAMSKADTSANNIDPLYLSRECALSLIRRSDATRQFLLHQPSPSVDINHLLTRRPAFIISTEEEQCGALSGRIALNYLLVPLFSNKNGLSGGLVATTYTKRTHPLHAPTVMAHVRLGRYLKDDNTGEWTFLTRNIADGLTRLQYVKVNQGLIRERVGMTCVSKHFDKEDFHQSVLFQCHDRQWRTCPMCTAPPKAKCGCLSTLSTLRKSRFAPLDEDGKNPSRLAQLTEMVLSEGDAKWQGHVRVTVLSNLTNSNLLNIDEYMTVFSTYRATPDPTLIAHIKSLAISERMREHACIPPLLHSNQQIEDEQVDQQEIQPRKEKHIQKIIQKQLEKHETGQKKFNSLSNPCLLDDPASSNILPDTYPIQDPLEEHQNHATAIAPPVVTDIDTAYEADRENEDQNNLDGNHRYAFGSINEENQNEMMTQKDRQQFPKEEPYLEAGVVAQADYYPAFTSEDLDEMFDKSANERANHYLVAPNTNIEEMLDDECAMLPADPSTLPGGTDLCLDGMVIDDDWCSRMTSDVDDNSASSTLSITGSDCAPKPESVPLPEFETLSPPDRLTEMDYISSFPEPSKLELPPQMKTSFMNKEEKEKSQNREKSKKKEDQMHTIYRSARQQSKPNPQPLHKQPDTSKTLQQSANLFTQLQPSNPQQKQNIPTSQPAVVPTFQAVPQSQFGAVPGQNIPGMPMGMVMPMMPMQIVPGANGMVPPNMTAQMSGMTGFAPYGARLAPRPAGMTVQDSVMLELGTAYNGNRAAIAARMTAIEKARKAEERRKKNRQAAARSNARKKDIMDSIKSQIKEVMKEAETLRTKERQLKERNVQLKKRLGSAH